MSVLVIGATGSGKEFFDRAIHENVAGLIKTLLLSISWKRSQVLLILLRTLSAIREKGLDTATAEAKSEGKVHMIHPDEKGCVSLEHRNDKYYCKLYNYRPKTCRGFRCNLADDSFLQLFGGDSAIHLLGQDTYGLPLK